MPGESLSKTRPQAALGSGENCSEVLMWGDILTSMVVPAYDLALVRLNEELEFRVSLGYVASSRPG